MRQIQVTLTLPPFLLIVVFCLLAARPKAADGQQDSVRSQRMESHFLYKRPCLVHSFNVDREPTPEEFIDVAFDTLYWNDYRGEKRSHIRGEGNFGIPFFERSKKDFSIAKIENFGDGKMSVTVVPLLAPADENAWIALEEEAADLQEFFVEFLKRSGERR